MYIHVSMFPVSLHDCPTFPVSLQDGSGGDPSDGRGPVRWEGMQRDVVCPHMQNVYCHNSIHDNHSPNFLDKLSRLCVYYSLQALQ